MGFSLDKMKPLDVDVKVRAAAAPPLVPTIFHEEWWLNIVTNSQYQMAEVSNGGRVVGRLPYCVKRRFGMLWNGMPHFTHFLGPAVDEGVGGSATRFAHRMEITRELITQLPKAHFTQIKCHRTVPDAICFQEQKFRVSVQFTYEIPPATEEVLWSSMRDKTRNVIRRAQENFTLDAKTDPSEYCAFYKRNLEAKGIRNYLDFEVFKKLIETCITRDSGCLYAIRDKTGALAAAIFCVWDGTSYYYLMSTRSDEAGNGGISLLIWEALKDASRRGLIFDFDGLYNAGGILLYSAFGGSVTPRYVATKASLPWTMAFGLFRSSAEHQWFT